MEITKETINKGLDFLKIIIFCFCLLQIAIAHEMLLDLRQENYHLTSSDYIYIIFLFFSFFYIFKMLQDYIIPIKYIPEDIKTQIISEAEKYYKNTRTGAIGLGWFFIFLHYSGFLLIALSELHNTTKPVATPSNYIIPGLVCLVIGLIIKSRGVIIYLSSTK